jgi:hypothetical protein
MREVVALSRAGHIKRLFSAASQVGIATTSSQRRQTKIQVPDDAAAFA